MTIRVLVPSVPNIDAVIPYIRRAEEAKWYTNFGVNVRELEQRLSDHYSGAYVVSVANCTVGLELAYTLKVIQGYRKIELPALTFPATWLAANRAGMEIKPIDVDPHTWTAPGVSGWGLPGYAPVQDAAAAFGEQSVPILKGGNMMAVFSMHATKVLPAAEAGYIVTWDEEEAEWIRRASNFGIDPEDKISKGWGTNAKLSEYHAALGLASLDAWPETKAKYLALDAMYRKHLPECVTQQKRPPGVYPILSVKLPNYPAARAMEEMKDRGIECRRWYTPTLDQHPMFERQGNRAERRKNPVKLPVTEDLAQHLIGLPFHLHLSERDIQYVCESLEEILEYATV